MTSSSSSSTPASVHLKTPAQITTHSHPLSPEIDEAPVISRRRTGRSHTGASTSSRGTGTKTNHEPSPVPKNSNNNYFALKAQLDAENSPANWDGSVRGYGNGRAEREKEKRRSMESNPSKASSSLSLAGMWERSSPAPLFVVGSSPDVIVTDETEISDVFGGPSHSLTAQVLAARWHEYDDEAIEGAVLRLNHSDSPSTDASSHPYYLALRVLSANMERVKVELEEQRRILRQKEDREKVRQERADALIRELVKPSEQDVARRVVRTIFSDGGEEEKGHRPEIRKVQSFMVSNP